MPNTSTPIPMATNGSEWSPDSKWILSDFIGIGGWNNKDVVLLNADGKGEMVNLTESGYTDGNAKWVLGGKAMIWIKRPRRISQSWQLGI